MGQFDKSLSDPLVSGGSLISLFLLFHRVLQFHTSHINVLVVYVVASVVVVAGGPGLWDGTVQVAKSGEMLGSLAGRWPFTGG